jgi:hypothetical protein
MRGFSRAHGKYLIADGCGPVFPVIRGQLNQQDLFYTGKVRLDFLWSLAFETK